MKVRILWQDGKIACCSQLCTEDCPNWGECVEAEINVKPSVLVSLDDVLKRYGLTRETLKEIGRQYMIKLEHDLSTEKNTVVYRETAEEMKYNAPHHFKVVESISNNEKYFGNTEYVEPRVLAEIHFQEGPIKERGLNGVFDQDLITMVICRLQNFQQSEFACRENEMAIIKLEEAMLWLRKRTMGREKRGVEGTSQV